MSRRDLNLVRLQICVASIARSMSCCSGRLSPDLIIDYSNEVEREGVTGGLHEEDGEQHCCWSAAWCELPELRRVADKPLHHRFRADAAECWSRSVKRSDTSEDDARHNQRSKSPQVRREFDPGIPL